MIINNFNAFTIKNMNDRRGDSMCKKLWMPLVVAAGVALSAAALDVAAQSKQGYWTEPAGGDAV